MGSAVRPGTNDWWYSSVTPYAVTSNVAVNTVDRVNGRPRPASRARQTRTAPTPYSIGCEIQSGTRAARPRSEMEETRNTSAIQATTRAQRRTGTQRTATASAREG